MDTEVSKCRAMAHHPCFSPSTSTVAQSSRIDLVRAQGVLGPLQEFRVGQRALPNGIREGQQERKNLLEGLVISISRLITLQAGVYDGDSGYDRNPGEP